MWNFILEVLSDFFCDPFGHPTHRSPEHLTADVQKLLAQYYGLPANVPIDPHWMFMRFSDGTSPGEVAAELMQGMEERSHV